MAMQDFPQGLPLVQCGAPEAADALSAAFDAVFADEEACFL
jgi:hypothetical protein